MPTIFNLSPIIRITLLSLYFALTVPMPFLAKVTNAPVTPTMLWIGIILGGMFLYGALSEKVCLNDDGIQVTYPQWFRWISRKGWSLNWSEIAELKMRTTGQGGMVYYFITPERDRAYLLPMRVAGFAKMVGIIEAKTEIDTSDVRPLSQPWMYMILFSFTVLLLLVDIWAIATAVTL
ncbi:MAG: hypothetical protein WBB82_15050 [Limnothrix sp.]